MRVYLDDERPTPAGWTGCRWPAEVIELLKTGEVTHLSLDHDLGDDARGTGYDVLVWLEEAVHAGLAPPVITLHTANAAARLRMQQAVDSIARLAQRR